MHENELFGDNKCTNNELKTKGNLINLNMYIHILILIFRHY